MSSVGNLPRGIGVSPIETLLGTAQSGGGSIPNPNSTVSGGFQSALNGLSSVPSAVASGVSNVVLSELFSSRVIAIVLGLIAIAGAILLYLGEDIAGAIGVGTKGAGKVAEVVAGKKGAGKIAEAVAEKKGAGKVAEAVAE